MTISQTAQTSAMTLNYSFTAPTAIALASAVSLKYDPQDPTRAQSGNTCSDVHISSHVLPPLERSQIF